MAFRSEREIERLTLPPGKSEAFHFDAKVPGLCVRIQKTGRPSYAVWYSVDGKRKRLALGPVAGIRLDEARRRATDIINGARDGRDPTIERAKARAAAVSALTLGELVERYIRHHAVKHQRPRTLVETRRYLERRFRALHELPAADVTRRDVSARLLELATEDGPIAANRARSKLSGCYAWAMRAGLVEVNPVVGAVKPGEETSRDRVLNPDELRAIWVAADEMAGYGRIIRLLMLTGGRRTEVGGMTWAEVDLDRGMWVLPAERAKNGLAHEVPLSRQALDALPVPPGDTAKQPFLFGRRGLSPFSGWSRCKERLDGKVNLPSWTLHDIRRSVVTRMAEIGIVPHIIEAVVGHISGHRSGVAGTYNRATYRREKSAALARWGDWLEELVEGRAAQVVRLR